MILKNEEKTIYKCLDSMKDFIDEWIIGIDDKTSDKTEEQVIKFFVDNKINYLYKESKQDKLLDKRQKDVKITNYLYKYTWQDHFAKARNEGMNKATGDYILIMDGHEFFPTQWYGVTEKKDLPVREIMHKVKEKIANEKPDEVFFQLYQQPFIGQIPNNYFMQPRIYINRSEVKYNRAAHNCIVGTDPKKSIHFPEVLIIHDAPENNRIERKEQRIRINRINLKKDIQKNPKDTRALFYLGNTFLENKQFKEAIECFEKYLKYRIDENTEKYQVLLHKALSHIQIEDYRNAKISLHMAISIDPLRRDAFSVLGDLYSKVKNYDRAIFYYNTALMINPKPSRMFSNGASYTWQPHQNIALAYKEKGDIQHAIAHLRAAYNYIPNSFWIDKIKKWTGNKKNILIIDSIGSFTNDIEKYLKDKGYNVVRVKKYENALGIWADVIFQEWADQNAIESSKTGKAVIRIHGYEAYLNKGLFNQIQWDKSKVIFVAKHIKEMMKPWINGTGKVIYNGIDIEKFYIKNYDRDKKNIGYAGLMNEKKNPYLLLKIIKSNSEYKFHLRIDWQSPFWEETFKYELKDCKNIVYHSRYKDLNDFWNQMNGVLSTSIIESFSFNIGEAMACGCKPYIYNWKGAKDIWNESFIFNDMPKFENDFTKEKMIEYRHYIEENYNLKDHLNNIEQELVK
jgi:tetratricopeptide (TPR) repeat protein